LSLTYNMDINEKWSLIQTYFEDFIPEPKTELNYENPFQLLVAVILSAQCTDKRVNKVTPKIFEDFPTPEKMSQSNYEQLFPYIQSVSYPNSKTKHLLSMSNSLVLDYNSQVPEDMTELQKLAGVGRKTANVITSVIFNKAAMAVDTHVFRVSKRLGLVSKDSKTPLAVENQLMQIIPESVVPKAHHWLILHGRYTCLARKPKCEICDLKKVCDHYQNL